MRTCISCNRSIEHRRKDAVFCEQAACRAKKYRERQADPAQTDVQGHVHKAGAVLSCACGRRYLLEVRGLDGAELPMLMPAATAEESVTRTVSIATESPSADTTAHVSVHTGVENSSEQIAPTPPTSHIPTPAVALQLGDTVVNSPPAPSLEHPELRTVELYFTDQTGRRMRFWDAVSERGRDSWRVRSYARLEVSFTRGAGTGLGGIPGRWRDYYSSRSPAEFGHETDLAVLYWDDDERRAYVVQITLMHEAMGSYWRTKLRELCESRSNAGSR